MSKSIASLVDRGLEIRGQMECLKDELTSIEAQLEEAGLAGDQVDLQDPNREGKQFLAEGSELIVPVIFTADLLVQSFTHQSAVHDRVKVAADDKLPAFYSMKTTWKMKAKSGKAFRVEAAEILGPKAPAFIAACRDVDKEGIPKSKVIVDWDRATLLNANT